MMQESVLNYKVKTFVVNRTRFGSIFWKYILRPPEKNYSLLHLKCFGRIPCNKSNFFQDLKLSIFSYSTHTGLCSKWESLSPLQYKKRVDFTGIFRFCADFWQIKTFGGALAPPPPTQLTTSLQPAPCSTSTPIINVRNVYQHQNWASAKYLT